MLQWQNIENDNDSEVGTQVARYLTEISNHYSVVIYCTLSPLQFALTILSRAEPFWNGITDRHSFDHEVEVLVELDVYDTEQVVTLTEVSCCTGCTF